MLACKSILLKFISVTDEFRTSITLKLVPVSTNIYILEWMFTTFFQ